MSSKYIQFYCPACLTDKHSIPTPYSADVGRRFSERFLNACDKCTTTPHSIPIPYSADVGRRFSKIPPNTCIMCITTPHTIPIAYSADVGRIFPQQRVDACELCQSDTQSIPVAYSADTGRRFSKRFAQNCYEEFKVFESTINTLDINIEITQLKFLRAAYGFNLNTCYTQVEESFDWNTELDAESPVNVRKTFVTTKLLPMLSTYAFKAFGDPFTYILNQGEKNVHATNDGLKLTPFVQPWDRLTPLSENLNYNIHPTSFKAYVKIMSPRIRYTYQKESQKFILEQILAKYNNTLKNIYLDSSTITAFYPEGYDPNTLQYDATSNYNFTYTISDKKYNLASFLYLDAMGNVASQKESELVKWADGINPSNLAQCIQYVADTCAYTYYPPSIIAHAYCCSNLNYYNYCTPQDMSGYTSSDEDNNGFHYRANPNAFSGWAHPQNNTNAAIQFKLSATTGYNDTYYGPSGTDINVLVPVLYDPKNTTNFKIDTQTVTFEMFQLQCVRESYDPNLNPDFDNFNNYYFPLEIMRTQCEQDGKYYFWSKRSQYADVEVYNFPLLYSRYITNNGPVMVVPTSWYDYVKGNKCVKNSIMNVTRIKKLALGSAGFTFPQKLIYYSFKDDSNYPPTRYSMYVSDAGDDIAGVTRVTTGNEIHLWDSYDTLIYHTMTQDKHIVKDPRRLDFLYDTTDVLTISSLPPLNN